MEPSSLLEWALHLAFAIFIFLTLTGLDEVISRMANGAPTKKDLEKRVEQLEARLSVLESNKG